MHKKISGKKIGIAVFCLILVFFAFLYLRKEKAQAQLSHILQQQGVELRRLDFGFLPQPTFSAEQVRYPLDEDNRRSVFFDKIEVRLGGLDALFGRFKFNRINLDNGSLRLSGDEAPDFHSINLQLKPTALYMTDLPVLINAIKNNDWSGWNTAEFTDKGRSELTLSAGNAQNDRIGFSGDINLLPTGILLNSVRAGIELARPTYGNNKDFKVEITDGYAGKGFSRSAGYEISGDLIRINDQDLGRTRAEIHAPGESRSGYSVVLTSAACNGCTTLLEFERQRESGRKVTFRTRYFPLDKLLGIFKLPVLITGESDVEAEILFNRELPAQGRFELQVSDGKLKGLNLLNLAAQYLPLLNAGGLEDKELETKFERFSARFGWQEQVVEIDDIYLLTPDLSVRGQGQAELLNMQCDVTLNVGPSDKKYSGLTLPIRFFDSCYSPQYEIKVNKHFRNQVKSFIKEKLN